MKSLLRTTLLLLSLVPLLTSSAFADPATVKKVKRKMTEGMEHYDLADFGDARKSLTDAIKLAKRNGVDEDPIAAEVYVRLGIVYFTQTKPDVQAAKVAFDKALSINPNIELPKLYSRPKMKELFEEMRGEKGGDDPTDACADVKAITHAPLDEAFINRKMVVKADVSPKLKAAEVKLHYRPSGAKDYLDVDMRLIEGCTYAGVVPSKNVRGNMIMYYIAAYNGSGKVISQKGSAGVPNPVTLEVATGDDPVENPSDKENPLDKEDPFNLNKKKKKRTTKPEKPSGPPKWFVGFGVGTGGGFVTGNTEQLQEEITPGFAPAWLHVNPEVGYYLSNKVGISLAVRLGFTAGANIMNHATLAPAGLIRLRYSFSEGHEGFQVNAALGGGFLRQVLSANEQGEKDTAVSGPVLVGVGAGYQFNLTRSLRFITELNAYAGIPIVSEVGGVTPHFGTQFDANIGVMFAF